MEIHYMELATQPLPACYANNILIHDTMANFQHLLRSLGFIIDNGHVDILIMEHIQYSAN